MERPIVECLDFEEFVGRSDAVYKSTRGATTDQKLKRKALCIGLIILAHPIYAWSQNKTQPEATALTPELLQRVDNLIQAAFNLFPELNQNGSDGKATTFQERVTIKQTIAGWDITLHPRPQSQLAGTPTPSPTKSPYTSEQITATQLAATNWAGLPEEEEGSESEETTQPPTKLTPTVLDEAQGSLMNIPTPTKTPTPTALKSAPNKYNNYSQLFNLFPFHS